MLYLFCILFLVYLVLYRRIEIRLIGNEKTPFYISALLTVPITILYAVSSNYLFYHSLILDTIFFLLLGYVVFSLPGLYFISIIKERKVSRRVLYGADFFNRRCLDIITFALSIMMLARAYAMGFNYADGDVAAAFAGKGIFGHILVIQMFIETHYLINIKKNDVFRIFLIVLLSICTLQYNVKVWIFAPFIVAFLVRTQFFNLKISLFKLLIIVGILFGFFILSYLPSFDYELNETQWIFLVDHFTKYVFAGVSGMNEALSLHLPMGQNPAYGLPPFVNIFFDFNYRIDPNYDYLVVNDLNGEYTNVYTLFGGSFLFNGILLGTIYIFVVSLLSYYFYYLQRKTYNYWYILSYYFWCLALLFSFFGNYYTLLNIYELPLYGLVCGYYCGRKDNSNKLRFL